MRSFVSIYYFFYWLIFALSIVQEIFRPFHVNLGGMVYTVLDFMVAIVRPYKTTLMNVSDTLILANLALFYIFYSLSVNYYYLSTFSTGALNSIPPLVLIATVTSKIYKNSKAALKKLRISSCCQFKKSIIGRSDEERLQESTTSFDSSDASNKIPDRPHAPSRNVQCREQLLR